MKYCRRSSRTVVWLWLVGGISLTGCVGPKRAGPFGVAVAIDTQHAGPHVVEQGETLYSVAKRYGISAASLAHYNGITEPGRLRIGQPLHVPPAVLRVAPMASVRAKAQPAPAKMRGRLPDLSADAIAAVNGKDAPSLPPEPETIAVAPMPPAVAPVPPAVAAPPVAVAPTAQLKPHSAATKLADALREAGRVGKIARGRHCALALQWPVTGRVTSLFGPRKGRAHDGIDIGAPVGSQVRAAADGDVVFADHHRGYGNVVIVRHGDGLMTIYAHHQRNLVAQGQHVRQGDPIAQVGSTGRASGPHLHFEVRRRAQPRDPLRFLPDTRS